MSTTDALQIALVTELARELQRKLTALTVRLEDVVERARKICPFCHAGEWTEEGKTKGKFMCSGCGAIALPGPGAVAKKVES